ncbi:MAG: hypothetical protein J6J23_07515 [Clostridia bacterium]|nr:hypothetical protein [Clostridia bacterium]
MEMSGGSSKWIWVVIVLSFLLFLAFIIEEIITGELFLTYILIAFLLYWAVHSIVAFVKNNKTKPKAKWLKESSDARIVYGNKINSLIDLNFNFGEFGLVRSENIDCEFVPRLSNDVNDKESINYSISIVKEWAEKIEKNKHYFANYIMYQVLSSVYEIDIKFWKDYRKNEERISDEDCYNEFKKIVNQDTFQELDKYLEIGTKQAIKEVYDKFDFFDYSGFMNGLTLGAFISADGYLGFMVKDKYCSVLDVVVVFDKELNDVEYVNDVDRDVLYITKK